MTVSLKAPIQVNVEMTTVRKLNDGENFKASQMKTYFAYINHRARQLLKVSMKIASSSQWSFEQFASNWDEDEGLGLTDNVGQVWTGHKEQMPVLKMLNVMGNQGGNQTDRPWETGNVSPLHAFKLIV